MLIGYKRGQGSIILRVKILDSSVSTGAGLTGLTSASAGLIISTIADNEATATAYTVAGSTIETITTLGTYAAPTATKCRFKEVDATNHKGVYEIQIADARFAVSSAKSLLISITGATNAADCDVVIPLRDLDPYDAVRAGLTALPNAVPDNTAGLPTADRLLAYFQLSLRQDAAIATDRAAELTLINTDEGTGAGAYDNTANPPVDAVAISGDTVAADNLEAILDGTGGVNVKVANLAATAGVTITQSTLNADGVSITGNGTGDGLHCMGGATGIGGHFSGGGTNGHGIYAVSNGGNGLTLAGGGSGHGLSAAGGASGLGVSVTTITSSGAVTFNSFTPNFAANSITAAVIAAGAVDADAVAADAAAEIAAACLAAGDIDGYTLEQAQKLVLAALVGKLSGAASTSVAIRAADDSKARITATVDTDGNRSAVVLDAAG